MYIIIENDCYDVDFVCVVETEEDAKKYCETMNLVRSDDSVSYYYETTGIKDIEQLLQNTYDEYKMVYYKDTGKITVNINRVTFLDDVPPPVSIYEGGYYDGTTILTAYEKYTEYHNRDLNIMKYREILEKKLK
jgi:hypothetical protein